MPVGVVSPARESNDTVAAKCRCSICDFSQCSVVLCHRLQHGSVEQRVYGVYARALANIDAKCVVIIHGHLLALMQVHGNSWDSLIPSENSCDSLIPSGNSQDNLIPSDTPYGGV